MMRNSYIAHHGVKGHRRIPCRWQNLDGSLTPAGYIHYGIHPREPKALNRDGSTTEYGRKRFNAALNKSYSDRSEVEEADVEMLMDYAKSLPEFENAVRTLSSNEWADVRKQIDDIWRQPDYESNPLYASFKQMLLEKNRKDPEYAGMTDDQIIYERNHHFCQDIDNMIQDHLLASKGLSFDQVYDENRAIAEAAASSIADKTIGDVQDWGFINHMSDKIREKADERIYHRGIPGQKWGERRFQNYDGTLTEAGRRRYYIKQGRFYTELNKRGKKLQQFVRDQAGKNEDILAKYDQEYERSRDLSTNPHAKRIVDYADGQWSKYVAARNRFEETGSNRDKRAMDLAYENYEDSMDALRGANKRDNDRLYEKYVSQLAERTLQQLGSEVTESGRRFVERLIDEYYKHDLD